MNDVILKERWTERFGADLRLRFFPLRPTSVFRREILAQAPIQCCVLLWFAAFLGVMGVYRENFDNVDLRLGVLAGIGTAVLFSLSIAGTLCGAEEESKKTLDFVRRLPLSPVRLVSEKIAGALVASVICGGLITFIGSVAFGLVNQDKIFQTIYELYRSPSFDFFRFFASPWPLAGLTCVIVSMALGNLLERPLLTALVSPVLFVLLMTGFLYLGAYVVESVPHGSMDSINNVFRIRGGLLIASSFLSVYVTIRRYQRAEVRR